MIRLLLVSFDPRYWMVMAQIIRRDENPAIFSMAIMGTLCFSAGLLSEIPYAHPALIILLSPILLVSLAGAVLAMCDSVRNVFSDGVGSSVFWFEFASAVLIAGVLMSTATIATFYFGFSIVELTGIPIVIAFVSFVISSIIGYVTIGEGESRPPSDGTVDLFLLSFLGGAFVVFPVFLFGRLIDPMYMIGGTVVAALVLAAALKFLRWKRKVVGADR